jgi:hypothetical protein
MVPGPLVLAVVACSFQWDIDHFLRLDTKKVNKKDLLFRQGGGIVNLSASIFALIFCVVCMAPATVSTLRVTGDYL